MFKNVFKKKSVIILSAVLAISIIAGAVVGLLIHLNTEKTVSDSAINVNHVYADNTFCENGGSAAFPSSLLFRLASNSSTEGVSVTLTATVTPVTAADKSVDWSVEWENGASRASEDVSDYITVTPSSDGSTTASVTCYKAFAGDNIIITVTTRVGGFRASCVCSFEGIPSSLTFDTSNLRVSNETFGSEDIEIVSLAAGSTYSIPLDYDNVYGTVGSSYVPTLKIGSITGYGEFVLKAGPKNNQLSSVGLTKTFDLDTFVDVKDTTVRNEYLKCYIEGNYLKIETNAIIDNLWSCYTYTNDEGSSTVYYNIFESLVDSSEVPYVEIKVTDTETGLSSVINVRLVSDVTAVTLSQSTIVY